MEHFKLFSNCKIVKGASRALMMDLQKEKSTLIPLDLAEIVERLESGSTIDALKQMYGAAEAIGQYLNFLVSGNYGFLCTRADFDLFPPIDFKFEIPNQISNAIIELNTVDAVFKDTIGQLHGLGCIYVSIVKYAPLSLAEINEINEIMRPIRMVSYEIHGKYDAALTPELIAGMTEVYHTKIVSLHLHNSPFAKKLEVGDIGSFDVHYIESDITSFKQCGVVNLKNFYTNIDNLAESLNHNSCLHKKLSIDQFGNIKNCPATTQSFGNIRDTTLADALRQPDFKKYWNITKDEIDVCKDCEFRHICTDCRAFTEQPENPYSKPLKCGYSPYTNQWEEWSTNPLKQSAIAFYDMQELIKKDVQISKL
ncbi:grasp-with-spasm system SPASM domain peptide maturase [Flavobacterium sp.]|uniref:grasp-with-spasm system SPASM domain peptide maturase n=1 Tax=Flavobacterium sp. TaxID=239 RepID=UPI0039E44A3A